MVKSRSDSDYGIKLFGAGKRRIVIPLEERRVNAGEQISLRIAYRFGGGFEQFSAVWAE